MIPIRTLEEIERAALSRRALLLHMGGRHRRVPAAFVLSMQARTVLIFLRKGMYLYQTATSKNKPDENPPHVL